jgi:predicted amidohydrolase YtcJ
MVLRPRRPVDCYVAGVSETPAPPRPRRLVGLLVLAGGLVAAWLLTGSPRRVLYFGGPIVTLDADGTVAEALAIEGDRIVGVGDRETLSAWAGATGAAVVHLGGRAILPGFIDAHGHFPGEGVFGVFVNLNCPPIGDVASMDDLVARLRARAEEEGDSDDWLVGISYDDTLLPERRHPTRRDLDRASSTRPIVAIHVSGHLAAVNGAGLERLGIDAATPDPEGGVIRRDPATGEPDGVLEETAAERVIQQMQAPGPFVGLEILREASRRYLAAGVTTAQSGYTEAGLIRVLLWASRLGLTPLRLVIWPAGDTALRMLDGELSFESRDPRQARIGAAKLIADGSIQGYTGYLSEPYFVPPGDDPGYRGYPRIAPDVLAEQVSRLHAAGWQVAVHGNGDAAIDEILDAFEQAQRAHPRDDARHVIIHAQMARDDQLDRMKALGVVPSFFSLHTFYWGDRHRTIFMGPERAARMSPAASALERGVRFTIHADSPVVPMEPLRLVWAAVNRKTRSGAVVGPDERITALQALRAVTIDAAWQGFQEDDRGSLEPGKLADFVILSESPLDHPDRIDTIRVLETVIGGKTRWRAGD